jgi:hypothetical protein
MGGTNKREEIIRRPMDGCKFRSKKEIKVTGRLSIRIKSYKRKNR